MKKIDLTGRRFHKLTVLRKTDKRSSAGAVMWECLCDCGNKKLFRTSELTTMGRKSCGCITGEASREAHTTHGRTPERLYKIWDNMKSRCYRPGLNSYKNYGAKGIKVCDAWLKFEAFRDWSLANGYADNLSIDRIDSKGNYEPNNCRWVTQKVQANNTSRTIFITKNGIRKPLMEWCQLLDLKPITVRKRIKLGYPEEYWLLTKKEIRTLKNKGVI